MELTQEIINRVQQEYQEKGIVVSNTEIKEKVLEQMEINTIPLNTGELVKFLKQLDEWELESRKVDFMIGPGKTINKKLGI